MTDRCKNWCANFTGIIQSLSGLGCITKYSDGWVRCTECQYFIKTKGLTCKCCKYLFRRNTRQKKVFE